MKCVSEAWCLVNQAIGMTLGHGHVENMSQTMIISFAFLC